MYLCTPRKYGPNLPKAAFMSACVCTYVDTDACQSSPCFPGVKCTPGRPNTDEFTCGACPPGTEGNGQICKPIDEVRVHPHVECMYVCMHACMQF